MAIRALQAAIWPFEVVGWFCTVAAVTVLGAMLAEGLRKPSPQPEFEARLRELRAVMLRESGQSEESPLDPAEFQLQLELARLRAQAKATKK